MDSTLKKIILSLWFLMLCLPLLPFAQETPAVTTEEIGQWVEQLGSLQKEEVDKAHESILQHKEEAFPILLTNASSHEKVSVRLACVEILSTYTNRTADIAFALLPRLTVENDSDILVKIIQIVGKGKNRDAIEPLRKNLEHMDTKVKLASILALASLDDSELPTLLVKRLNEEPVPQVRVALLKSLAVLQDTNAILSALEIFPNPVKTIEQGEILMALCDCAAVSQAPLAQKILLEVATLHAEASVRAYALEKLLPRVTAANAGILISCLSDSEQKNREMAFQKLQEVTQKTMDYNPQSPAADRTMSVAKWQEWWQVARLFSGLKDAEKEKQAEILKEVANLSETSAPYLIEWYSKVSPEIQKELIPLLGRWNQSAVVDHLISVVSEGGEIEKAALEALANLYTQDANTKIQTVLKSAFEKAEGERKLWLASYLYRDAEVLSFLKGLLANEKEAANVLALVEKNKIDQDEINAILVNYLQSENKELKDRSFSLLLSLRKGNLLIAHFGALEPEKKIALIEKLQKENKEALELLLPHFKTEKDSVVKTKLAQALANLPQAQKEITSLVEKEMTPDLAKVILPALKKQNALPAYLLMESYKQQKDAQTQLSILESLPIESTKEVNEFLQGILQSKDAEEVRTEALKRLLLTEDTDSTVKIVLSILPTSENASLRLAWASLIKNRVQDEHQELLRSALEKEKQNDVRSALVGCLTTVTYAKALPILQSILSAEQEDLGVKKEALEQLLNFKQTETVDYLISLSAKASGAWKNVLYEKIAGLDKQKALPLLVKAMEGDKPEVAAYPLLALIAPNEAKKSFQHVLDKAANDEEKLLVLQANPGLGVEHFDLLMGFLPKANAALAAHIAATLNRITGLHNEYDANNKEQQEKSIESWKAWQKDAADIQALLVSLLEKKSTPEVAEIQKKLQGYGEKALAPLANALLKSAKTAEDKILILNTLPEIEKSALILRSAADDASPEVRREVYRKLYMLQDVAFLQNLPFYYLQETEALGQWILLSFMSDSRIAVYENRLPVLGASTDPQIFPLAAEVIHRTKRQDKTNLLLQILSQVEGENLFLKIFAMVEKELDAKDLPQITALLEKRESPKIAETLLAALKSFPALASAPTTDRKSYLAWWKENEAALQKQSALKNLVSEYLGQASVAAEQKIQTLSAEEKKVVASDLMARFSNANLSAEAKAKILRFLAQAKAQEAQKLFIEALASEDPQVRETAVRHLIEVGIDPENEVVKNAASHEDSVVRFYAIQIMGARKSPALQPILVKALEDADARVREEALYWLSQMGFDDKESVKKLLEEKSPAIKALAFDLSAKLGIPGAMKAMVSELESPFQPVREAAYKGLTKLSGQTIAYNPREKSEKMQEGVQKWALWYEGYESKEKLSRLVEKLLEEDIDKDATKGQIIALYNGTEKRTIQEDNRQVLLSLLTDKRPLLRKEVVNVIAALGDKNLLPSLADMLLDEDAAVRDAAYTAIEKMSTSKIKLEKPPSAYDAKTAETWKQTVKKWSQEWNQEEHNILVANEIIKLEKDAAEIKSAENLYTVEQIAAAKKTIGYLRHSLPEVRVKAWDILKKFTKETSFHLEGTLEERNEDIQDLEKWIVETAKKLEAQNAEIQEQIAEVANKRGDLKTLEGCEELRNVVDEMAGVQHPLVLKAYVDLLASKGCDVVGFDVYADAKTKSKMIQKLADFLYYQKNRLKAALKEGEKKE